MSEDDPLAYCPLCLKPLEYGWGAFHCGTCKTSFNGTDEPDEVLSIEQVEARKSADNLSWEAAKRDGLIR